MPARRNVIADSVADVDTVQPANVEISGAEGATASELRRQKSDFSRMRDHLAKQPKVRVRVQEDTFAQLNGYTFLIKAGESVMVPEQVYELLLNAGRV